MPRGTEHRNRLLRVLAILEQETDAEHRLTLTQLMERLDMDPNDENGRRNVRNDLSALTAAGHPVEYERHKAPEYYLSGRRFSTKELKVLIDLVQSARTIPQEMSDNMVRSILSLGSGFEAKSIVTKVRVRNRVKLFNDKLLDSIWEIKKAIDSRRKISFRYFHYGFDFERIYHSDGTVETPLVLTHVDGAHYVITYSDVEEDTKTRRVDRMTEVTLLEERATWRPELQGYDIDESTLFGMFFGEEKVVTLIAREQAMNALIDRFGRNMTIGNVREIEKDGTTERYADVTVKVSVSPQFVGWLRGLEGLVEWKNPF